MEHAHPSHLFQIGLKKPVWLLCGKEWPKQAESLTIPAGERSSLQDAGRRQLQLLLPTTDGVVGDPAWAGHKHGWTSGGLGAAGSSGGQAYA